MQTPSKTAVMDVGLVWGCDRQRDCCTAWFDQGMRAVWINQPRADDPLSLLEGALAGGLVGVLAASDASRRWSCASRSAAEMLNVRSVIDWRFRLLLA